MADKQLTFSILQLVALSLPAFAILLQVVAESDMAYTHRAVPITTAGMGLFLISGAIAIVELLLAMTTIIATMALGFALLGIFGLLIGVILIGRHIGMEQRRQRDSEG